LSKTTVNQISLSSFRNYQSLDIDFSKNTNILLGKNAQGKTSILEAIYMIGLTKSHKTTKDPDVIQSNAEFAKIKAECRLKDEDIHLEVVISKSGKKAKYNNIEVERLSEYVGLLNVVMFAPEDLNLIRGNPQNRRKFLDLEIGQMSKDYMYNLQNYKKVLKQRNDLLKSMQKETSPNMMLLDIITDQLIDYLIQVVATRKRFIRKINEFALKNYQELSKTKHRLSIEYLPSVKDHYKEEFQRKYQYDIITGSTSIGAHRDDVEFYIDDFTIKTHGSQGELRTAVLAIKLALVDFIYEFTKSYPILLLDDVFSELDQERQKGLFDYISDKTQTFITTTELDEQMEKYTHEVHKYLVLDGTIRRVT
jgi:DNA replication and repair protein RecF